MLIFTLCFLALLNFLDANNNHYTGNDDLYSIPDPPLLIVSVAYPETAFTIIGTEHHDRRAYIVNLAEVTEKTLPFQIFHSYYKSNKSGIWFEWIEGNIDKEIRSYSNFRQNDEPYFPLIVKSPRKLSIIGNGSEIHATDIYDEVDELFVLNVPIPDEPYFFNLIKDGNKCATAVMKASEDEGKFSLLFKECDGSVDQKFTFVSLMKTVCFLNIKELCDDRKGYIDFAESVVRKRIQTLGS